MIDVEQITNSQIPFQLKLDGVEVKLINEGDLTLMDIDTIEIKNIVREKLSTQNLTLLDEHFQLGNLNGVLVAKGLVNVNKDTGLPYLL